MALPKIVSKIGSAAGSVAMAPINIAKNVGKAVIRSTGISAFKPSNIAASISRDTGLSDVVDLAKASSTAKKDSSSTSKSSGVDTSTKDTDQKLDVIADQTKKTADNTDKLSDSSIQSSITLKEILSSIQEMSRNTQQQSTSSATEPAKKEGGGGKLGALFGLLGTLGSLGLNGLIGTVKLGLSGLKALGALVSGPLFTMLTTLGKFALRFAGPIGLVVTALLAIEKADWEKMFGNFSDVINTFKEGKWMEGIVKAFGSIGELIKASVKGIIATILDFFGFKEASQKVKDFFDSFDVKEIFMSIFNFVKDLPNKISKLITDASEFLWEKVKAVPDEIGKLGTNLKEWVIEKVTSLADAVKGFFNLLSPSNILKSFKNKLAGTWLGRQLGFKSDEEKEADKTKEIERKITESALQNVDPTIQYAPELGITKKDQHAQLTRTEQVAEERRVFSEQTLSKQQRRDQLRRWGIPTQAPIGLSLAQEAASGLIGQPAAAPGVTASNIASGKVSIAPASQKPIVINSGGNSVFGGMPSGIGGVSAVGGGGSSSPINTSRQPTMMQLNLYGMPGFVPSNN